MDLETISKIIAIREWLQENGIAFCRQMRRPGEDAEPDMHIRGYDINVRIERGNEYDQKFYMAYRHRHPVFVRKSDSPDFLIEKVQGAIIDKMQRQQKTRVRILKRNNKNDNEGKDKENK